MDQTHLAKVILSNLTYHLSNLLELFQLNVRTSYRCLWYKYTTLHLDAKFPLYSTPEEIYLIFYNENTKYFEVFEKKTYVSMTFFDEIYFKVSLWLRHICPQ